MSVEPIWGPEDFISTYIKTGNTVSRDNPGPHSACMLTLLSQATSNCVFRISDLEKRKCRLHPFVIQKSRTGKDRALKFSKMVANETDISVQSVSDHTKAGLIGGKERGAAERYDILAFPEMETLLTDITRNKALADIINQIMDGSEINREAHGIERSFTPTCSLLGLSTPPEDKVDVEELVKGGTLNRFLYFYRDIESDFYSQTNYWLEQEATNNQQSRNSAESTEKDLRRLGATIAAIDEHYEDNFEFKLEWESDSLEDLLYQVGFQNLGVDTEAEAFEEQFEQSNDEKGVIDNVYLAISKEYPPAVQKLMESARTEYVVHALRVGCLMAALDECSEVVDESHMYHGLRLMTNSYESMLKYYEYYLDNPETVPYSALREKYKRLQNEMDLLQVLVRNPGITKQELEEILDITGPTLRDYVEKLNNSEHLTDEDIIEVDKNGKQNRYYPYWGEVRKPKSGHSQ